MPCMGSFLEGLPRDCNYRDTPPCCDTHVHTGSLTTHSLCKLTHTQWHVHASHPVHTPSSHLQHLPCVVCTHILHIPRHILFALASFLIFLCPQSAWCSWTPPCFINAHAACTQPWPMRVPHTQTCTHAPRHAPVTIYMYPVTPVGNHLCEP